MQIVLTSKLGNDILYLTIKLGKGDVIMDKEEILEKSRKENDISDERIEYIGLKGAYFSMSVLTILWILLSRFTPLDDSANYAMGLLVTVTCFSNWTYQFIKVRTKTSVFFMILFFLAAVIFLILFLKYVYHLF